MSTVTVLPSSPLELSRSPFHSKGISFPSSASGPLRPKLSLNTTCSQKRTLGKGNTGLRLDTLSADTPTLRNTYKNSYCAETLSNHSPKPPTPHPSAQDAQPRSSPKRALSALSASPHASPTQLADAPYTLGKHPRSILTNGPLRKRPKSRGSDDVATAASRAADEANRRVAFHEQLSEDIHNKQYIARHIDLLLQPSPSPADTGSGPTTATQTTNPARSDGSSEDSTDDEAGLPQTPVAGRKKRRRDWVWTLGPIESTETEESQEDKPDVPCMAMPKAPSKKMK